MGTNEPVVVLVHGGFLGPWIWADVTDLLSKAGLTSACVDLPSTREADADLHADAQAVLDRYDNVVLCGHSYAGAVISEAAAGPHPAVRHLVYLTAAVPDTGDSLATLAGPVEPEGGEQPEQLPDGRIALPPASALEALFHDCEPDRARQAISLLRPSNPQVNAQPAKAAAWHQIPATYVRAEDDRLPYELVAPGFLAQAPEVLSLPTGHCPQWSRPDLVAALLTRTARTT